MADVDFEWSARTIFSEAKARLGCFVRTFNATLKSQQHSSRNKLTASNSVRQRDDQSQCDIPSVLNNDLKSKAGKTFVTISLFYRERAEMRTLYGVHNKAFDIYWIAFCNVRLTWRLARHWKCITKIAYMWNLNDIQLNIWCALCKYNARRGTLALPPPVSWKVAI